MSTDERPEIEKLEETGALEADVGAKFDEQLTKIEPWLKIEVDPKAHQQFRPEMMVIRHELRQATQQTLAVRRYALKQLLLRDCLIEDCELRKIGLAYASPDL